MRNPNSNGLNNAYSMLWTEFLFILLPFVVSGIVFSYKGDYYRLMYMPEWSLAASVLIGQSLVKFISGMVGNSGIYTAHRERVALGISFLIVICLAPALIILCLVLVEGTLSRGLIIAQIIIFLLGVAVFFAFGAGGETLMRVKEAGSK